MRNIGEIADNIEASGERLRQATAGHRKTVAYQMRLVGKRISENGVKKWFAVEDTARTNWLKQAKQALFGLFEATPAGFELIVTDLELFIRELRRRRIGANTIYALPNPVMSEIEKKTIQISSLVRQIQDACVMEAI